MCTETPPWAQGMTQHAARSHRSNTGRDQPSQPPAKSLLPADVCKQLKPPTSGSSGRCVSLHGSKGPAQNKTTQARGEGRRRPFGARSLAAHALCTPARVPLRGARHMITWRACMYARAAQRARQPDSCFARLPARARTICCKWNKRITGGGVPIEKIVQPGYIRVVDRRGAGERPLASAVCQVRAQGHRNSHRGGACNKEHITSLPSPNSLLAVLRACVHAWVRGVRARQRVRACNAWCMATVL